MPLCPTCGGARFVSTAPRRESFIHSYASSQRLAAMDLAAPRIPCPAKCAEPYSWNVARLEADAKIIAAQREADDRAAEAGQYAADNARWEHDNAGAVV